MSGSDFLKQCREFGKARLAINDQAKSQEDWQRLWNDPAYPYIFEWGPCWKFCVEYRVDDYAAELGFFIDVLGLDCNALGKDFAMLMNGEAEFYFAIKPAGDAAATPPDALRLQFMLKDPVGIASELERRGVVFDKTPEPDSPGSSLYHGALRTPHGVPVDIWGVVEVPSSDE